MYASEEHPTQKDVTTKIFKGEHKILSMISWFERESVSKGFIKCLKYWIILNEDRAEELS